ncbi:MAG: ATP-dependent DNA helicase RecG [Acidobacteria bacterium]|nr:ATP-dependent DNA helicase RecG [Acidobacteriota bacterium]
MITLSTPILELESELPRVGKKTAQNLAGSIALLNACSSSAQAKVEDLLLYLPMRYEDRSNLAKIADLAEGMEAAVAVEVKVAGNYRVGKANQHKIFELSGSDETGRIRAFWWNQPFLEKTFLRDSRVILFGQWKYDTYRNSLTIESPDYEIIDKETDPSQDAIHMGRSVPVYRKLGDIRTKQLRSIMHNLLEKIDFSTVVENLPLQILVRNNLLTRGEALKQIHFPPENVSLDSYNQAISPAHQRLIFEEFFWLLLGLAVKRSEREKEPKGTKIEINDSVRQAVLNILPFKPTNAQKRVLKEIVTDLASDRPMNRLLQGDVGAGKTIVAAQAIVVAIENGYQTVLMVPTEILAEQHTRNIKKLFAKTNYRVELLTGSLTAKEKRTVKAAIAANEIQLVIGTHAVIQDDVKFASLGLVVIDEQHRFGVMQRAELIRRGYRPDVLVMTATPIPRSLAMTVYGDLDVSIIDELPPGRTPIDTRIRGEASRDKVYQFIAEEVRQGRQCYIVYPLVEESEKMDLAAATKMAEVLQKDIFPQFSIGLLHGRMKPQEKEEVMKNFIARQSHILVSTTVIEVGVDVPNASVMMIEHAERFGFSQLHQLRGRVGRGAAKSYCILMTAGSKSKESNERLKVLEQTTDGFKISEKDLELRGPGEILGTRQSGEQIFRVANIVRDRKLLELARQEADLLLTLSHNDKLAYQLIQRVIEQPRFGLASIG